MIPRLSQMVGRRDEVAVPTVTPMASTAPIADASARSRVPIVTLNVEANTAIGSWTACHNATADLGAFHKCLSPFRLGN